MNKQNLNKNKTKSRHIQIDYAFLLLDLAYKQRTWKDGYSAWRPSKKEDFFSITCYNAWYGANPILFNKNNRD